MIDVQALGHEGVLRRHHVGVRVVRKCRLHPVARLARPTVPNVVGQDDEILRGIERLPRAEKLARKFRTDELRPGAPGSVHDENRVHDLAGAVPADGAEGLVVKPELR